MRSALLCVFFALVTTQQSRAVEEDDFRPTPIPLDDWRHDKRGHRAGTLHEFIKTDTPPTIAALPAHYWEDALRHSVYLTLVRDKIDQLISKGVVISPDASPEQHFTKDVDDHDLWEKIKSAPFDRRGEQELSSTGDVQIMAKGRLMDEDGSFRFTEDETTTKNCLDDACADGVKAFWSVKRVRQRDDEALPGKYHYELTFSVTSQMPKKKRKSYENSIRTFTVRETEPPKEHWTHEPMNHSPRPQRAIWFHKNINSAPHHHPRHSYHHKPNLDRIFSSLFTDEDIFDNFPQKYKFNPYPTQNFSPHPKVSFVAPHGEILDQKKLLPYPYKPHTYKFSRPLPPPPVQHFQHPQHHFLELELPFNHPHSFPYTDQGYMSSNTVKTTRPVFLPTPVTLPFTKNESMDTEEKYLNVTKTTFSDTDTVKELDSNLKVQPRPRPKAVKLNYFPENVRPPVFNTPPGVFVTMDKKPFKPMPPLKLIHSSKQGKSKPIDFRPSPQVLLDGQLSNPMPSLDAEFRPIAMGYTEDEKDSKDKNVTDKLVPKLLPKTVKNTLLRTTTYVPDIITANDESNEDTDAMEYTNIIGAITRTTPMASQTEKSNVIINETSTTTTTIPPTAITLTSSTTTEAISTTTRQILQSSTTKPKKRTRPPPKFKGPEKFKKHKRVTSTTAKTSTTTEASKSTKSELDLTPQASSASLSSKKNFKAFSKNNTSTTPVSKEPATKTTTIKPSTTMTTTTTTEPTTTTTLPTTTTEKEPTVPTTQPKSKNRFRQSTLMHKGTSVKHDRWSTTSLDKNRTVPLSKQFPPRRKGSNFQGYISTTTKKEEKKELEHHINNTTTVTTAASSTSGVTTENNIVSVSPATSPTYEETVDQYDFNSEATSDFVHSSEEQRSPSDNESININNEQETKDQSEYIFTANTSPTISTLEIDQERASSITEALVPSSTSSTKKKCKKKKPQHESNTDESNTQLNEFPNTDSSTVSISTTTSTEKAVTPDIIDELLGAFTFDEPSDATKGVHSTPKPELEVAASENVESYLHSDNNFEGFLGTFSDKENENDVNESDEYDDDDNTDLAEEESSFFREDDPSERETNDYKDYQDRSYSLLELMSME